MSIKQIDQATQEDGKGIEKKINAGAVRLIYDVLQSTQYSTPIASTVRELTTNAWDSQREKEIAIEILTGEKQVSDYFIEREGVQYEDSNFDPSYYSLDHLDTDMNQVELRYTKNLGTGFCDTFEIIDFGVGLGHKRLEGILSLGFSTKRNTTEGFGAFGLGAKVALSTGVPFYSIESVHQGRKFSCNCYPYKTLFTVPKFNIEKGVENPHVVFEDGNIVYYEEVEDLNHTIVSFGVKKHNRTAFKEAVEEQLLYVDNVILTVVDAETDIPYEQSEVTKAEIVYNSDSLILSEGTVFNKPHIVIVKSPKDQAGINYGMVDFRELEMEEMYGSIGFKCPIKQSYRDDDGMEIVIHEGVSVTPSREKVIWDDATKKYIQAVILKATGEAGSIVEEQLDNVDDLVEWIRMSRAIFTKLDSNSVLGKMSNIIDTKDVSPKFHLHPEIKYGALHNMLRGVQIEVVKANYRGKPQRDVANAWSDIPSLDNIYLKDGRYSPHKDIYLCESQGMGSFLTITKQGLLDEDRAKLFAKNPNLVEKEEEYRELIWKLISKEDSLPLYSEIEVPPEVKEKLEEMEAEDEAKSADPLSPADKRKLEEREVGFTIRLSSDRKRSYSYKEGDEWVLDKVEPKMKELLHAEEETYYTTSEEKDVMRSVALMIGPYTPTAVQAYGTTRGDNSEPAFFRLSPSAHYNWNGQSKTDLSGHKSPQLVQLRRDLIKKIPSTSSLRPIHELVRRRTKDGTMTTHPDIIKSYTRRTIGADWNTFKYMQNFKNVDNTIYEKYTKLLDFMDGPQYFFSDIFDEKAERNPVIAYADKLWEMQRFCMFAESEEDVKEKSKSLFILSDIKNAHIVDMEMVELHQELQDYNEGVGGLLNLLDNKCYQDPKGAAEVRRYLKACSRDNWSWSTD